MNLKVRLTALVLCAAMGVSLYGCRYSSVLEQIIYEMTKSNDIEDQYFYPEQNVEDSDNNTEDLVPIDEDETNRTRDEVMNLPTDEEENSDRGAQLKYDENAYSDQNTSRHSSNSTQSGTKGSGTNTTTTTTNGTGNSTRGDTNTSNGIANNNGTGSGSDTVQQSLNEGTGTAGNGLSGSNYEPTTNADPEDPHFDGGSGGNGDGSSGGGGEAQNLPVAGTVAAVGSVALMVMMLTGTDDNPTGALVATNENLKNSASANQVFPGLSTLKSAWADDGTQSVDLGAVQESQADIVAYEGTKYFATAEQEADIKNMYADITGTNDDHILILADMTSSQENVETNMRTLAQTLSDLYPEAESRAEDYINWSRDVQAFAGSNSDVTWANTQTLYIDGWDSDVQYSMMLNWRENCYTGTGCAYISSQGTALGKSVITYMGIGGITDTIKTSNSSWPSTYYFVPVSPYSSVQKGTWSYNITSLGIANFYNSNDYYQMFTAAGSNSWGSGEGLGLGNSGFKTLVAGNANAQAGIMGEKHTTENGQNGSWGVYGTASGTAGEGGTNYWTIEHGFNNQGGYLMASYIYGDYNVVVNPCGLASDWVTAGPESILESAWVAYKLRGVGNYDEMADLVRRFYRDLCRYPQISDEQIYGILMEYYNTLTYY